MILEVKILTAKTFKYRKHERIEDARKISKTESFVTLQVKPLNYCCKAPHLRFSWEYHPVDTRRRFNVYKTSMRRR